MKLYDRLIWALFIKLLKKRGYIYIDLKQDKNEDMEAFTITNNKSYIEAIEKIEIE